MRVAVVGANLLGCASAFYVRQALDANRADRRKAADGAGEDNDNDNDNDETEPLTARPDDAAAADTEVDPDSEDEIVIFEQLFLAPHDPNRGPLLGGDLGELQGSVFEVECCQLGLAALVAAFTPVEASGDHQVDDQVQIIVERQDETFAEAAGTRWRHPFERIDRRIEALERGDARDPDLLDRVPDDVAVERLEVVDHVGVLRHGCTVLSPP